MKFPLNQRRLAQVKNIIQADQFFHLFGDLEVTHDSVSWMMADSEKFSFGINVIFDSMRLHGYSQCGF